jgi:hypothetical protein
MRKIYQISISRFELELIVKSAITFYNWNRTAQFRLFPVVHISFQDRNITNHIFDFGITYKENTKQNSRIFA